MDETDLSGNSIRCCYADDVIIHAKSQAQAGQVLEAVRQRLKECRLELHPEKTKIVYCQDDDRKGQHEHIKFDFLGYTFGLGGPRIRRGKFFVSFLPAISNKAAGGPRDHPGLAAGRHPEQPVSGRHREACQPFGTWLGELLRTVLPIRAHPGPQTPGACSHQVGMSEVQMVAASLHERSALAGTGSATRSSSVRFVADGDSTGDWIIRAG